MAGFRVITSNKEKTVGVVVGLSQLKDVGDFTIKNLEAWIAQAKLVLGTDADIRIQFKLSEDVKAPGYIICASHDGMEPHVAVVGKHLADGTPWEDEKKLPEKKETEKKGPIK